MEILGIGPLELLFIILIALIILGPKDLEKTGKSIGKGLTKMVRSDTWKTVQQASDKVRSLPTELMRRSGIDEIEQSLNSKVVQPVINEQKLLDSRASESRGTESTVPEKDPTGNPSGEAHTIATPNPKEQPK